MPYLTDIKVNINKKNLNYYLKLKYNNIIKTKMEEFKKPSFYKSVNASSYKVKSISKKNTNFTQILKQYLPYVGSMF